MAAREGYEVRQYPGSQDFRQASPRSCGLINGIITDDEFFQNANCHMQVMDHGLKNVGLFAQNNPSFEKYQKIMPKEKLTFQALVRRGVRRRREAPPQAPDIPQEDTVNPPVVAYSTLPEILQTGRARELYKSRLSRLLVVKFVNFNKQSFKTEFLEVIHQIKAMNERYSTEIPLVLVSNYYNDDFVQMVARKYCDKNLSTHVIKQPLFPLVVKVPYDTTRQSHYFAVARKEIPEDQLHMPPHMVPLPDWYNPGEVFTLLEQVKSHITANEKEYILVLNSRMEKVIDLKILNYLCSHPGPKIDVCLEVVKPTEADLNNGCDFFVQTGERLRVLGQNSLEEMGYNIADGLILTKNMWINISFLSREESETVLLRMVLAKELEVGDRTEIRLEMTLADLIESTDALCSAVEIPSQRLAPRGPLAWLWQKLHPTWAQKIQPKTVAIYSICSVFYHLMIYVMTASLHEKYLKTEVDANADAAEKLKIELAKENRELTVFWIENAVWFLLLIIYFLILTSKRFKNAILTRSEHQSQRRAIVDFAQAILLGCSRFIYSGLNKSAEIKDWWGGNAWIYLIVVHSISCVVELLGSFLLMYLLEVPNVIEPVETA